MVIEYNGQSSADYGLYITMLEDNETLLSRSPITSDKNKYRPRDLHFGTKYEQNYSFTMRVIKNMCNVTGSLPTLSADGVLIYDNYDELFIDDNGVLQQGKGSSLVVDGYGVLNVDSTPYFSSSEVCNINAWLTSAQYPKLLKISDSEYFNEDIEFYALVTEVTAEHFSRPYELIYTVVCDSPFGYTPTITHQISAISTVPVTVNITNYSDELEGYVYPTFKIHPKSHSDLTIKNITDDGEMTISMLKDDDFYIDCEHLMIRDITGSLISFDDLGISGNDELYWPRLCAGINKLEIQGNADIEISYREVRKVGAF